jgi:predicted sulfurtransferase
MSPEESIQKEILAYLADKAESVSRKKLRKRVFANHNLSEEKFSSEEQKSVFKSQLQALIDDYQVIYDPDKDTLTMSISQKDRPKEKKRSAKEDDEEEDPMASNQGNKRQRSNSAGSITSHGSHKKEDGPITILLFYAYCEPQMTRQQQDRAIQECSKCLKKNQVSGRLRVGREGYNATLTGPYDGVRNFTSFLRAFDPATFQHTDFKYVDHQPENQRLKDLKVWPVTEIVTYGFNPQDAPLNMRGTHLRPEEFHQALAKPESVLIDVRNFNETIIGRFDPPRPPGQSLNEKVLDPHMRRSTEFPQWVEENKHKLEGKQVLMCCTAGVRCERASAYMRMQGVENVYQLEGGIHRYLDAFPEDGGYWAGKNYTFDKRFSHGAKESTVISSCVVCAEPWERYQAQKKCVKCSMEVLVCRSCQRRKDPPIDNKSLFCPLCK